MDRSDFLISDDSCTARHSSPRTPEIEYTRRLRERQRHLLRVRRLHSHLWAYLIVAALAVVLLALTSLSIHSISIVWALPPFITMLTMLHMLAGNARVHSRTQRIVDFYQLNLARLRDQWQGKGMDGLDFKPDQHPYATDLDIFGKGSLFELLCTARTGIGGETLATWLLHPATCHEAVERQVAITELRDRLDLREDWASVGAPSLDHVRSTAVREWAESPPVLISRFDRAVAMTLPCLIVLLILGRVYLGGQIWLWGIALTVLLEAILSAILLKRIRLAIDDLVLPSFELRRLAPLFDRIEAEQFQSPLLRSLQATLNAASGRSSRQIKHLSVLVWLLDLRQSEYFALPSSLLLWGTNFAILTERWRQRNQADLLKWLNSMGQFEALLCMARYYYENPDQTFPVIQPQATASFHAEALGHPLLSRKTCVPCDHLESNEIQVAIVSGSNMSGKSTLLRSVGLNAVLAFAGAPVRAARLTLSPMQVGCSIGVQDSILHAKSRYQAEVERIKWILTLSRSGSLLFLMDEMLGGTNSSDRLYGAQMIVAHLVESGAVGLLTTHDLALAELSRRLQRRAINVHFAENYQDGEMTFDYVMQPGVLTNTNGLNVMAALGIFPKEMT